MKSRMFKILKIEISFLALSLKAPSGVVEGVSKDGLLERRTQNGIHLVRSLHLFQNKRHVSFGRTVLDICGEISSSLLGRSGNSCSPAGDSENLEEGNRQPYSL